MFGDTSPMWDRWGDNYSHRPLVCACVQWWVTVPKSPNTNVKPEGQKETKSTQDRHALTTVLMLYVCMCECGVWFQIIGCATHQSHVRCALIPWLSKQASVEMPVACVECTTLTLDLPEIIIPCHVGYHTSLLLVLSALPQTNVDMYKSDLRRRRKPATISFSLFSPTKYTHTHIPVEYTETTSNAFILAFKSNVVFFYQSCT